MTRLSIPAFIKWPIIFSQCAREKGTVRRMVSRGVNQKLLILGASGFIGSNLIRRWAKRPFLATYLTRPVSGGMLFDIARERLRDHVLRPGHGFTHAVLAQ